MALDIYYIGSNFGSGSDCRAACAAALAAKLMSLGCNALAEGESLTVTVEGRDYTLPMDMFSGTSGIIASANYGLLLMRNPAAGEIIICSMYAGSSYSTPINYSFNSSLLLCRSPEGTGLQVVGVCGEGDSIVSRWSDGVYGAFNLVNDNEAQNAADYVILSQAVCRGRQLLLNCYVAPLYLVAGTTLDVDGERMVCLGGPLYYRL